MQTKPVNSIFNEWKDWAALVIQPLSWLTKPIKELQRQSQFKLLTKENLALSNHIYFILIFDLLYIVQKAEDCFPNCLCQGT